MAWFRKDKKPRSPRRDRLEIPVDAWEKCERCGYTDITEKFVRNLNVCPNCGFHRRIRAWEYANIFLDEGTAEETEVEIRSADPLGFPEYPARLKKATVNAGEGDAVLTLTGQLGGSPVSLGDYLAGSNHVLPTGGQARFAPGLGAHTFLRSQQVIRYDRQALAAVKTKIVALATAEDLPAHAAAVTARFSDR